MVASAINLLRSQQSAPSNATSEEQAIAAAAAGQDFLGNADTFQVGVGFSFTDLTADVNGDPGPVDLSDYTQFRTSVRVTTAGVSGIIRMVYSKDRFSTSHDLGSLTLSLAVAGLFATDWEDIVPDARDVIGLVASASGGNGSEDPNGMIVLQFRR